MPTNTPSVETILAEAVEIAAPADRQAYLDQACSDNADLRQRVERLVADHFRAGSFLDRPAVLLETADQPALEAIGTRIGPYKLLEVIGEGGMGVVYLAAQTEPVRREVALKVIKPGMDSAQVIARFEAERQALALMDHPNIAKVLEAGTTDAGRPYFVMELVHGIPITDYCDQARLGVPARLKLFIDVCRAVQHAHQKGVIHRDLKPTNVLVTSHDGVPVAKVIDFGVAKALGPALTERTLHTGFAQMIGTPLYMSPEQAEFNQLGVDTRSDVYALGVLLYELLTGVTPFDPETLKTAALDELRRIIREVEPPRPSHRLHTLTAEAQSTASQRRGVDGRRLGQTLRGELDWIVMRALEKDRTRRYESASAFAADVQRYLSGDPVEACPPSATYRLRKYVRRHPARVVVCGLLVLVVILGVLGGMAAWQWQITETARDQAESARGQADAARGEAVTALLGEQTAKAGEADARRRLEAAINLHRVTLARHAWLDNDVVQARLLLERCPVEFRNWEWRFVHRLCHEETLILPWTIYPRLVSTTAAGARNIAFSPDGRRLAGRVSNTAVRVWDFASGREVWRREHPGGSFVMRCVAYSPDGRHVATGGEQRSIGQRGPPIYQTVSSEVIIWDAATGEKVQALPEPGGVVYRVAFSPDSGRLAVSVILPLGNQPLVAGQMTYASPTRAGESAGKQLGSPGDFTVKVWDLAGQNALALTGHAGFVEGLAFSPDGQTLTTAASGLPDFRRTQFAITSPVKPEQTEVKVWDLRTGQASRTVILGREGDETADMYGWLAITPDGQRVARPARDNTIRIWDLDTQKESLTLKGHTDRVRSCVFSPDGKLLASGGYDATVRVWDLTDGREIRCWRGHTGLVQSLAFSADGQRVASESYDDTVRVWDLGPPAATRTIKRPADDYFTGVAFHPNGRQLATGIQGPSYTPDRQQRTAGISLRDVATGQEVDRFLGFEHPIHHFALSPDGQRLAGIDIRYQGKVWHLTTRQVTDIQGPALRRVSFSPDSRYVVGGGLPAANRGRISPSMRSGGFPVYVCDAATGQEVHVFRGHAAMVNSAVFSPDGARLASVSADGGIKVWDWKTRQELFTLPGHAKSVNDVTFSPDGRHLATASNDKTIKVWDLATRQEVVTLHGHADSVGYIAFSPDGTRLASAGDTGSASLPDRRVKVWDWQVGEEVLSFGAFLGQIAFSPDGQQLAATSKDGVTIWDATPLVSPHAPGGRPPP